MCAEAKQRQDLAGLRILVVEDELLVALELESMLDGLGCRLVGPAARLDAAVALAQTAELDGAVLDVNLRGTPVYPVAAALRARGIPFIFSTGYSNSASVPEPFRDDARIEKPFSQDNLARLMARTFGIRDDQPPDGREASSG